MEFREHLSVYSLINKHSVFMNSNRDFCFEQEQISAHAKKKGSTTEDAQRRKRLFAFALPDTSYPSY